MGRCARGAYDPAGTCLGSAQLQTLTLQFAECTCAAEEFRQLLASEQWGAAHEVLMAQLAPAWALRGSSGWAELGRAARSLQDRELDVDAVSGPGAFARGAGLLCIHAQAQVRFLTED